MRGRCFSGCASMAVVKGRQIGPVLAAVILSGSLLAGISQGAIMSFVTELPGPDVDWRAAITANLLADDVSPPIYDYSIYSSSPAPLPPAPSPHPLLILAGHSDDGPALGTGPGMSGASQVTGNPTGFGGYAWSSPAVLSLTLTSGWLQFQHSRLMLPLPPLWELLRPA